MRTGCVQSTESVVRVLSAAETNGVGTLAQLAQGSGLRVVLQLLHMMAELLRTPGGRIARDAAALLSLLLTTLHRTARGSEMLRSALALLTDTRATRQQPAFFLPALLSDCVSAATGTPAPQRSSRSSLMCVVRACACGASRALRSRLSNSATSVPLSSRLGGRYWARVRGKRVGRLAGAGRRTHVGGGGAQGDILAAQAVCTMSVGRPGTCSRPSRPTLRSTPNRTHSWLVRWRGFKHGLWSRSDASAPALRDAVWRAHSPLPPCWPRCTQSRRNRASLSSRS